MTLPKQCPNCTQPLAGSKIIEQGPITWDEIIGVLIRSGMIATPIRHPPGTDRYYAVQIECQHCQKKLADFLIAGAALPESIPQYNDKVALYEKSNTVPEEVLGEGLNITIVRKNVKL